MSLGERGPFARTGRSSAKRRKAPQTRSAPGERARVLWAQSQVASQSARLLMENGDATGTVNRAYYALFGGARAALATVGSRLALSKRHGTIFRRFEKHFVEERGFDRSLGKRFLLKQRSVRNAADYGTTQTDEATARTMIADMQVFLVALEPYLAPRAARDVDRLSAPAVPVRSGP